MPPQQLLLPASRLQILVIASTDAPKRPYIEAARLSIARHFKVHIYTDEDVPSCKVCPIDSSVYHSGRHVLPRYNDAPFVHKSPGGPLGG